MHGISDNPELLIFFSQFKTLIELLPIFIYGAVAGLASYLNSDSKERKNFIRLFKVILFNSILCATIYGLALEFGLSYLAAVSLGAFVSLMGLDKTLDVGDKLFSLIRSGPKKDDKGCNNHERH